MADFGCKSDIEFSVDGSIKDELSCPVLNVLEHQSNRGTAAPSVA